MNRLFFRRKISSAQLRRKLTQDVPRASPARGPHAVSDSKWCVLPQTSSFPPGKRVLYAGPMQFNQVTLVGVGSATPTPSANHPTPAGQRPE